VESVRQVPPGCLACAELLAACTFKLRGRVPVTRNIVIEVCPFVATLLVPNTMASEDAPHPLAESGVTIPSDSEQYSGGEDISMSPPSSSSPAVILYQPPTIWSILRGAAINLFLPFVNGMMMGFGELFAHEAAFRLGWSGTRVRRILHEARRRARTGSLTMDCAGIPAIAKTSAPDWARHRSCGQA
jgi:hypothetical protein